MRTPRKWYFIECFDGGLYRNTYVAQVHTANAFISETTDRIVASKFKELVELHNLQLGNTSKCKCDEVARRYWWTYCPIHGVKNNPVAL